MTFEPGDIVAIRVLGIISHLGIVTPWGTVISASLFHGGVVEQPFMEFANDKAVHFVGHPRVLPVQVVLQRAASRINQPWNLLNANCEHFVYWAHGLQPRSPQLTRAASLIAICVFGSLLARA